MKAWIFVLLAMVLTSYTVNGATEKNSTIENADYLCANRDMAIAIRVNGINKIWKSDYNMAKKMVSRMGEELKSVKLDIMNCEHCLSFNGDLNGNVHIKGDMYAGPKDKATLDIKMIQNGDPDQMTKMKMVCKSLTVF